MIGLAKVVIVTVSLASLLSGGALVALTGGPGPGSGSDYGLDTDGDGAFDWLVVKMDLSVERPNWYNVWATLGTDKPFGGGCGFGGPVPLGGPYMGRDGLTILPEESAYPISWASVRQFFEAGDHQVSLAFKGTEISYAGVDGPYTVQAQAYADGEWDGRIMDPSFGAPMPGPSRWDWTYVTGSYHADAFEQPRFAIQFTGTPDDAGLDLDADGLYDYLVISTEADVALGGMYSIGGSLYVGQDPRTTVWVAGTWGFVELREGRQTIEYRFNGADVWASGQAGSFHFTLDAYYGGGVWWGNGTGIREGEPYPGPTGDFDFYGDNACGTTSEYRHEQFEERVEPAKYTGVFRDYGEDYDGDGQFEALAVEAEVEVTEANVFDFSGQLASQDGFTWISGAYQQMYLDVGVHMLALRFPGPDIRRSGVDGPYRVDLNLVVAMRDPATTIYTAPYVYTDFAEGGNGTRGSIWIAEFSVDVQDGGPDGYRPLIVAVTVERGLDLLAVVMDGILRFEVFGADGTSIYGEEAISLPSGGSTQSISWGTGLEPGTYTVRATLESPWGNDRAETAVTF